MKKLCSKISLVLLLLNAKAYSQSILPVVSKQDAKFSVAIVSDPANADLKVFRTIVENEATGNKGVWFIGEGDGPGKTKIYWTKDSAIADINIFLVNKGSDAGWLNSRKKNLLD